jgi:hypothetical protein
MNSAQRTALSSYMTRLLSLGGVVFSAEAARKALGVSHGALLDAAERQQRKKHLVSPPARILGHRPAPVPLMGVTAAAVVHR